MNNIEFDKYPTNKYWDRYKAFFKHDDKRGVFKLFETGEVILDAWSISHRERGYYSSLDVTLAFPDEFKGGTFALPDGTPVPKAWLTQYSQPTLLLDHKHKILVNAEMRSNYGTRKPIYLINGEQMPFHLRQATVLYTNQTAKPQGKCSITVSRPVELTPQQRKWVAELIRLCKVTAKVTPQSNLSINQYVFNPNTKLDADAYAMEPAEYFKQLDPKERNYIGYTGLQFKRQEIECGHLLWIPK